MNTVKNFLKAKKTGFWWWVAFLGALYAAGYMALIFLVAVLLFDATMLSNTATGWMVMSITAALIAGGFGCYIEYPVWKNPRNQPTERPHNW